eukprot:784967-Rhodomonas_salina.8
MHQRRRDSLAVNSSLRSGWTCAEASRGRLDADRVVCDLPQGVVTQNVRARKTQAVKHIRPSPSEHRPATGRSAPT